MLGIGGEHSTDPALTELTVLQGQQRETKVNDTGMEDKLQTSQRPVQLQLLYLEMLRQALHRR